MPDDSARIIEPGERCKCDRYLKFESMCDHECAKHGGTFVRSLFSERLFQSCQTVIEESVQAVIDDEDEDEEDSVDFTQVVEDDDDDEDDDDSVVDNITLAELALRKRPWYDIIGSGKKQKVVRVTHTKMASACAILADLACSKKGKPERSVVILACILQLQDLVRGEVVDNVKRKLKRPSKLHNQGHCNQDMAPKPTKKEERAQR
jgi:hypothetical protein